MNDRVKDGIETFTNVFVVVFLISSAVVFFRYQNVDAKHANGQARITAGSRFVINEVNWSDNEMTLVFALSTQCHYCNESAEFFKRTINIISKQPKAGFMAIFPQDENAARDYLSRQGVSIPRIRSLNPSSIGIRGTPTLLLVDRLGIIRRIWEGRVMPEKEEVTINEMLQILEHR